MVRAITFSVVVVLAVETAAFGAIQIVSNTQYMLNHFDSNVNVSGPGGIGSASMSTDFTKVLPSGGLYQSGSTNSSGTEAHQLITGTLSETAKVTTHDNGGMTVGQTLDAETVGVTIGTTAVPVGQTQTMKCDGTGSQSQALGTVGTQDISKTTGGGASGNGENKLNLAQLQCASGTGTDMGESLGVVGNQKGSLQGDATATGTVVSTVAVVIGQIQSVK
jgi:hypothetical protein